MVDEEEYLRPFVVLDELLATKIFFNKKIEKNGFILNSKNGLRRRWLMAAGFNGIINFHNFLLAKTLFGLLKTNKLVQIV